MEKSNNRVLNELLVNLFHNVMDAEAKAAMYGTIKVRSTSTSMAVMQ